MPITPAGGAGIVGVGGLYAPPAFDETQRQPLQYFGEEAENWDYSEGTELERFPATVQQSDVPTQPPEDAPTFDEDSDDTDEWVLRRGTDTTVQVPVPSTQYFGEDAELLFDETEDEYPLDDYSNISLSASQYFGEEAECYFDDADDDTPLDEFSNDPGSQYFGEEAENYFDDFDEDQWPLDEFSLRGTHVPEDVFDHFSDIDEEWFWLDDAIGADANPQLTIEDAWHFGDDDSIDDTPLDDTSVGPNATVVNAQYYGEDAETADLDIDDDDWLTRDSDPVGPNIVASLAADEWDFTQDDDEWLLDDYLNDIPSSLASEDFWFWDDETFDETTLDDYALSNLVVNAQYYGEDAENAEVDFDDDSWITAIEPIGPNPTIVNAQYYAEDAENADVDFDDDEWLARDSDPVGPSIIQPSPYEDSWDWSQDDDEYALDDYLNDAPAVVFEDAWNHFEDIDDDYPIDDQAAFAPPPDAAIDDPWNYFDDADDDWQLDEYAFSTPIGSPVEDAPVFDDEVSDSIDEFLEWSALSANLFIPPSQFTDDSWWYWTDEFLDDYEAVGFDYAIIGAPVNPKPTQLTVKCAKTKCSVTTATTQLVVTIYEPKLGLF